MGESKTAFLTAMSEGRCATSKLPSWLLTAATSVLRGLPGTLQPDDVVQAFLESVFVDGAKRRARVPWHLHSDAAALALVRRRMRQLACEMTDGWNYRRALRSHVDAALKTGLPDAPAELPFSICDSDRLSRPLIASAAAWMVVEQHACRTTRELTQKLKELYSLQPMLAANDEPLEAADLDAEAPDDQVEAQFLASTIGHVLGPDALLFGLRLGDHKLQALSDATGHAVTTVHERTTKAFRRVQQVLLDSGCSRNVACSALRHVAEAAA